MNSPRTVYLVSTKQLQDQIEQDFHIPVLKGRNNYPCLKFEKLFPEVTSEICREYLGDGQCEFERDCPYLRQKREALSAPICVLNYPLFFTEANYVGGFSNLTYLVADEVDKAEDYLMSFIEVPITPYLMRRLSIGPPRCKTKLESWVEWVGDLKTRSQQEIKKMGLAEELSPVKLKDLIRLKKINHRLGFLAANLDDSWVMEQEGDKALGPIVFKPVRIGDFGPDNLWKHTQRSLGMSATIIGPQAMAMELGLRSWDVASIHLPSPFPIEDRRVEYVPVANVTHKTKEQAYPKLVRATEEILKKYPKEKVLVHTVSYDLRNYFIRHLTPTYHGIMTHETADRAIVLEKFKSYDRPVVLISPSMERGVDLPGDLCRVIVIAKLPYPNLASPQVNKRLHGFSDGNLWYARRTARSLVQMSGRATRYLGDWSISFILDEQFGHLVSRSGNLFPSWYKEAVRSGSL